MAFSSTNIDLKAIVAVIANAPLHRFGGSDSQFYFQFDDNHRLVVEPIYANRRRPFLRIEKRRSLGPFRWWHTVCAFEDFDVHTKIMGAISPRLREIEQAKTARGLRKVAHRLSHC